MRRKAETVRPAVVMSCKYYNSRMTTPIGLVPTLEVGILNQEHNPSGLALIGLVFC